MMTLVVGGVSQSGWWSRNVRTCEEAELHEGLRARLAHGASLGQLGALKQLTLA
jgi:hypothetical protein